MTRFLRTYWFSILVAAAILYASLLREPHVRLNVVHNMDKLAHFVAYFVLGVSLTHALFRDGRTFLSRALWAVLLPVAYGGIIELLQGAFFAPRTADWQDFLANTTGALAAYVLTDAICRAHRCKRCD